MSLHKLAPVRKTSKEDYKVEFKITTIDEEDK